MTKDAYINNLDHYYSLLLGCLVTPKTGEAPLSDGPGWRHATYQGTGGEQQVSLVTTYLFIVHVRFKPVPEAARWKSIAQEHETQAADVGGVAVVDEAHHLGYHHVTTVCLGVNSTCFLVSFRV